MADRASTSDSGLSSDLAKMLTIQWIEGWERDA